MLTTRMNPKKREDRSAYFASYRAENRARITERAALARSEHPEREKECRAKRKVRIAETSAAYHASNRESILRRKREYSQQNKEKIAERKRAYRAKNKDAIARSVRAYNLANPEKGRAITIRRRAKKRGATIGKTSTIRAWEKQWKARRFVVCFWCRGSSPPKTCHTDHIKPLAKGGAHSIENLAVSCAPCNMKKGARLIEDWNRTLVAPVLL